MVVIIIGILAAIALPSMLNQANKARLSAAKNAAGAINRAQQAYRLERTSFAETVTQLGVGSSITAVEGYTVAMSGGTATTAQIGLTATDTAGTGVRGCVTADAGTTSATVRTGTNNNAPDCPTS